MHICKTKRSGIYSLLMQKIEITHKTIIFTILFLLSLKFLWIVKDLIFSLFIAFIILSALKPAVTFLEKKSVPRGIAAFFVYIIFLGFFVEVLTIAVPPLLMESARLIRSFPGIFQSTFPNLSLFINTEAVSSYIPNITGRFIDVIKSIFSNAVFTISTIFFGFYFLAEEDLVKKYIGRFFELNQIRRIVTVFESAEKRMNAWFWGELVLMTIVGLMTFLGLNLIGMKYVLPLAVLAGLLEVVPNLGPVLSAVPAVIIGFSSSYLLGASALALYFIVQQLENNFIVPLVMKKTVGLNPIITLMALIIGGKVGGILGVLLAIPTTLFIETIFIEVAKNR